MTRPEVYRLYLFDLGRILKERARQVARDRNSEPAGSSGRDFADGQVIAFNAVISIMQQQAEGFNISLADLQLEDIVPDRDLL